MLTATYKNKIAPSLRKSINIAGAKTGVPSPLNRFNTFGDSALLRSYTKDIRSFDGELSAEKLSITVADEGTNIATYLYGSTLIGKDLYVNVYAENPADNQRIFTGFVFGESYNYADLQLDIECYDRLYYVQETKFLFDYKNMKLDKGAMRFGTVLRVSGTSIYFHAPSDNPFAPYYRTWGRRWKSDNHTIIGYGNPETRWAFRSIDGLSADTYRAQYGSSFINEQTAKFSKTDYSGDYGNTNFDELPEFKINSGTLIYGSFFDNPWNSPGYYVLHGTMSLPEVAGLNVSAGDIIYFKKPLVLSGNPADLIYGMVTGTHTNMSETFGLIPVDENSYGLATTYFQNFDAFKVIRDSEPGDIAKEVRAISKEYMFDVYLDWEGTLKFGLVKPQNNTLTTVGSYVADENSWGFQMETSLETAPGFMTGKFNKRSYLTATLSDEVQVSRQRSRQYFSNKTIEDERDFSYSNTPNEAIANLSREMFWRRKGVKTFNWEAPLFGLDLDLGSYTEIQTIGLDGSHVIYMNSIEVDFQRSIMRMSGWDYTHTFANYYIGLWQGNGTANPTSVSGTSLSGWSRLDEDVIGTAESVFEVTGIASGSFATVRVDIGFEGNANYLSTTGIQFKHVRLLQAFAPHEDHLFHYDRIFGAGACGIGDHALYGEDKQEVEKCARAIPGLTNSYGEFIGGTIFNYNVDYGSVNIFW